MKREEWKWNRDKEENFVEPLHRILVRRNSAGTFYHKLFV